MERKRVLSLQILIEGLPGRFQIVEFDKRHGLFFVLSQVLPETFFKATEFGGYVCFGNSENDPDVAITLVVQIQEEERAI